MLKDILLISIGSISAIIGGFFSMWYQAKKARKLRFEERVGEKMVDACSKAYSLILDVNSKYLTDRKLQEDALSIIEPNNDWVNENRFFFPEFYDKWCSIRKELLNCEEAKFYPEAVDDEQKRESYKRIKNLIGEAEKILLKNLKK